MQNKLKLHHIGVATRNIKKELETFSKLGYVKCSDIFEDEIQQMKGLFIKAQNQPCLELIEGIGDDNPVKSHILKGNKFYHIAYETKNIEQDLENFINKQKARVIVPITKAVYFEKICFILLPNMMLVELVQLKGNLDE
ncbi:VOC family protein [bacterium]|nr:VOC family protein [bacterium]